MILDLLEYFEITSNENKNKLILDNYILKNGLYIKISEDGIKNSLFVNTVKNITTEKIIYNENQERNYIIIDSFKNLDYISNCLNINKAIDPKKILHSNNYLTVFFKYENWDKVFEINLDIFYNSFEKKFNEKSIKKILDANNFEKIDFENLNRIKEIVINYKEKIFELVEKSELKKGDYIKIFYDAPDDLYEYESNRYLYSNIFNKNDYNIDSKNNLLGLSNLNISANSKKPFLLHKTTNFEVPFRITSRQGLDGKKLLDFLYDAKQKILIKNELTTISAWSGILNLKSSIENESFALKPFNEYENSLGYIIKLNRSDGETIFTDLDFNPKLPTQFNCLELENYLKIELKKDKIYKTITSRESFVALLNENLFDGFFYKTDVYNRNYLKSIISTTKKAILEYLNLDNSKNLISIIDKMTLNLTLEKIQPSAINSLTKKSIYYLTDSIYKALNMRLNLLRYFKIGGKENMGQRLIELHKNLLENINRKENFEHCQNDTEFYFASGQIVYYLMSLSQAEKLDLNLLNNILNSKNSAFLKDHIARLQKTYSHGIDFKNYRYLNLLSFITMYETENKKVMEDIFLAGFSSKPNTIYQKIEAQNETTIIEGDVLND